MQITPREKKLALGGISLVVAWILYGYVVQPLRARIDTLRRVIPEKEQTLAQVKLQQAEYQELQYRLHTIRQRIESMPADFSLLAMLENVLDTEKLTSHVISIKQQNRDQTSGYTENQVTLEMEKITLGQLVSFLQSLQSGDSLVQVNTLEIRKNPDHPDLLDADLLITSPQAGTATAKEE